MRVIEQASRPGIDTTEDNSLQTHSYVSSILVRGFLPGREGKGREGKGREGKGREGKGREGKGREGKGRDDYLC
jgi:hypothetical protein